MTLRFPELRSPDFRNSMAMGKRSGGGVPSVFSMDFANAAYSPAPLGSLNTFSRGSAGASDNAAGVWSNFLTNIPRITNNGLRYEAATTNLLRNNTMAGAAAGSPGTLPTNWADTPIGLTRTISNLTTTNGMETVDIRYSGVTTGQNASIDMDTSTGIPWAQNDVAAQSVFIALVAGSLANISSFGMRNLTFTAAHSFLGVNVGPSFVPNATLTRYGWVKKIADATVGFLIPGLYFNTSAASGQAVDFTIRIARPQLEKSNNIPAPITSPIATSSVAVARSADLLTVTQHGADYVVVTSAAGGQQTISINSALDYAVPTTLIHPVISKLVGYAGANPVTQVPPTSSGPLNSVYGQSGQSWWAINNPWNRGSDVMGTNFQNLIEVHPLTFPAGTVQSWAWPPTSDGFSIRSYDAIIFGRGMTNSLQPAGISNPTSKKINQFTALSLAYNATIGGDTTQFDVMSNVFLTSIINGQAADEVCALVIAPHLPWAITQAYQFTAHGWDFYLGSNGVTPEFIIVPTGGAHGAAVVAAANFSGTLNILQMLTDIIANGAGLVGVAVGSYSGTGPVLTGNEFASGIQWGPEVRGGIGSLTTNALSAVWT